MKIGNLQLPEFPLLLAPMEDVSDPPFRRLCKQYGADLMFSEFISSEGLIRNAIKSQQKLDIFEEERPVGIQIFGGDEEAMSLSAKIVETVQPDLIDINFGCPVKKVVSKGAGAAVLKDVERMVKLTKAVVQSTHLPVTVKTRLGWDEDHINILEVAERLQDVGIQALTVHARTRSQMYKGQSDWSYFEKLKSNPNLVIPIFGNGDIDSPQKAQEFKKNYPVDGMMIGRASIGNPWIFQQIKQYFATGELAPEPGISERVEACRNHLLWSIQWKGEIVGLNEMKRHYAHYFKGIENSKVYRNELVKAKNPEKILEILEEIDKVF